MTWFFPATLIYNFALLIVVVFAIRSMNRRRGFGAWCAAISLAGGAAVLLGLLLGGLFENSFGMVRLWCYGLFLHAPVLFAATAVIWRRKLPAAVAAAAAATALLSVAYYSFLVEPFRLEVTRYRIFSGKIARPVRIVVVADLQTDRIGANEREALRWAMAEKPDLLIFAGDYIQAPWERQEVLCRQMGELLRECGVSAPLGAFAVRGNVDPPEWERIFHGTKVTAVETTRSFDLGRLRLTCLSLDDSRRTLPIKRGLSQFSRRVEAGDVDPHNRRENGTVPLATEQTDDRFHIILGHVPDFALGNKRVDLLIAGHSHGGQIRLPWLGPVIVNCRLSRRMICGLNDLPGGGKLLVSRGIGMERGYAPRLRFLCRPELAVIDLLPEEEGAADESE